MSLLIGIGLGQVVVLAADSLHTWDRPGGRKEVHDDIKKISETPSGLIVASGSINIFESVVDRLKITGYTNPGDIAQQLRTSRDDFHKKVVTAGLTPPATDRTNLLITFVEGDAVQLRLFHHDEDFAETVPAIGALLLLLPTDAQPAVDTDVKSQLAANLDAAFEKGPEGVVVALRDYFRYYHEKHPATVGSRFQYAIQLPQLKNVSELIPVK